MDVAEKEVSFGDSNTYRIVITTIEVRKSVGQREKPKVTERNGQINSRA